MAEIVKDLGEAETKGFINPQKNQSDIGKIVSDVKSIIEGVKELRGVKPQENLQSNSNLTQMENKNIVPKGHKEEPQKIPFAVLKIDEEEINNYLELDIKKIFDNENVKPETTLKEIVEKWDFLKELLRPEIKKAVGKIARADLEFK